MARSLCSRRDPLFGVGLPRAIARKRRGRAAWRTSRGWSRKGEAPLLPDSTLRYPHRDSSPVRQVVRQRASKRPHRGRGDGAFHYLSAQRRSDFSEFFEILFRFVSRVVSGRNEAPSLRVAWTGRGSGDGASAVVSACTPPGLSGPDSGLSRLQVGREAQEPAMSSVSREALGDQLDLGDECGFGWQTQSSTLRSESPKPGRVERTALLLRPA